MMPAMHLSPEIANFIQQGVAAAAGSCNAALQPSTARVLASRVDAGRERITLLLARRQNETFVQDAQTQQQLAVVFCLPSTERALQIKGTAVRVEAVQAADAALVIGHNAAFTDQITPKGYSAEFAVCYHQLDCVDDLVALSFAPQAVFEQTPGPQAGQAMSGA